jgi:hypothetical protein
MTTHERIQVALTALLTLAVPVAAENIDPSGNGSQYAWAENVGWINAEPSGNGAVGVQVGDFGLVGWMWAENVGWISLSCTNTNSCATTSYGVRNDGQGVLSGYAWAENLGWINFAPATAGVFIDPATGDFSGRAWGENIGWITFAGGAPHPFKVQTSWVCSAATPPGESPDVRVAPAFDGDYTIYWTLAGGTAFDVVRGDLASLRATGSFTASVNACLRDNLTANYFRDLSVPPAGNGFWYLVRPLNCAGAGTYGSAQRDQEIAASASACE